MRLKPCSVPALLCFLSFFTFAPSSSMDFPAPRKRSGIHETQDGRDLASKSYERIEEVLDFESRKEYARHLSSTTQNNHDLEDNFDDVDIKPCSLASELLHQIKSASGSEWVIDNRTLEILDNDPQELIQCTESGDRIVFDLTGVHKFKHTLIVSHSLEFVGTSPELGDTYNGTRGSATFTCPDDGPFLRIKSEGFNASGFVVNNCMNSTRDGTIVIQSNSKVTFENMTFSGHQIRAIFVASNANLTLNSCFFTNNGDPNSAGGAIFAHNNVFLLITNSIFYRNIASFGGALCSTNHAILIIVSSNFYGNKAFRSGGSIMMWSYNNVSIMNATLLGNNGPDGGAIFLVENNNVSIRGTMLSGNYVEKKGGAIYLRTNNALKIYSTMLSGNTASFGGGIMVDYLSNVTIINATFSGNNAADGGAIGVFSGNSLTIMSSILSRNHAQYNGGGIFAPKRNNLTILNTTLSGNAAGYNGGGIFAPNNNSLVIITTTLSGNNAAYGGAISLYDGNKFTVKNTVLSGNTAYMHGGAISLSSSFSYSISNTTMPGKDTSTCNGASSLLNNNRLTIMKTKLLGNSASRHGGAIWIQSNNQLEISNTIFLGNRAMVGGAIFISDKSKFSIKNTTLSGDNTSWDTGFLSLSSRDSLTISNTVLSRNRAYVSGGAIMLNSDDDLDISNITWAGSNASIDGVITLCSADHLTILNSTLLGNRAYFLGGAVGFASSWTYSLGSPGLRGGIGSCIGLSYCIKRDNRLIVSNTMLSRNRAKREGGAMNLNRWTNASISNTTFSGNKAASGGAICLYYHNSLTIMNTLLTGNLASEHGGAVSASSDNIVAIVDSELSENMAKWHGGALQVGSDGVLKIENSLLLGNGATWGGSMYLEPNIIANFSLSNFTNNNASRGGAIYADLDCDISIIRSSIVRNRAEFGGCVYGLRLSTKVKTTYFGDNASSQSGGCLYIDSSTLYVEHSQWFRNEATKEGGAILALARTLLSLDKSKIISNQAYYGGGLALRSNSRVICQESEFRNNTAYGGGGVHIESQTKQIVVAQFVMSLFRNNVAQQYGGGMVIKTFGTRSSNCTNLVEPCSRVLFFATRFVNNTALMSGSAILVTKLDSVLLACEMSPFGHNYSRLSDISFIRHEQDMDRLKVLTDSKAPCESWQNNRLIGGTNGSMIQTFGQRLNLEIDSTGGPQMSGDIDSGYELRNIKSGVALPAIKITAIDAFGRSHVPTLHSDALVLSSSEFLNQSIGLSFENGTGIVKNIISFVVPKRYLLQLKPRYDDDILEATNLTIIVRDCVINEVSTLEGKLCFECDGISYNFDLSRKRACTPCPEHAKCKARYIIPKDGYWHQGPCHDKVKKCIVEEACEDKDRLEKLENFSRGFDNCSLSEATLSNYSKVQCHEGYEGPLCGSCKKSYGVSSSFNCFKCGQIIASVFTLIAITCYLLLGTSGIIKGVLPLESTQHASDDDKTPLLEANTSTLETTSSHQPSEAIEANNDHSQTDDSQEPTSPSSAMEQLKHEIEIAKQKAIETWKILLNFLQVTSTAANMNVKWTDEVLGTMKKLQVCSAATISSIYRPIDCLFSSTSRATRVIWRTLFSIFIPSSVIAILAMYWGYRAIMVHEGDGSYFLKRLLLTVITTTYITYFDLTQVAVRVFNCVVVHVNIDPLSKSFTRSWIADTSVECYKGAHVVLIGIALVILIFVSIGFPFLCSLALHANKNEVTMSSSWAHDTLSFLCGPFKEKFVYWECVTMMKKAMLSIVIVFSYSLGNQVQGLLILMILGFFLYLHQLCNPYNEAFNTLNYFEGGSLLTSCAIYTLVQFLNVETLSEFSRHSVSVCLIVLACSFASVMVYKTISNIICLLRMILESKHVQVQTNINWFSVMRIYYQNRKKRPFA